MNDLVHHQSYAGVRKNHLEPINPRKNKPIEYMQDSFVHSFIRPFSSHLLNNNRVPVTVPGIRDTNMNNMGLLLLRNQ